jgi:hypothetical protein
MKKSLFLIVLTALLCLVCALALTACEEEPAHTHTWGEWVTVTPATCTEQGVQTRVCECGQSESGYIPVSHLPDGWESNGTYHWQVCTRTGCGAQVNKTAHTPAWSSSATNHWKNCAVCGYGMASATPHTYDAENTCVCGDYKDKGVRFTLSSGTYTVTDYSGTATEVVIPATYKGVAVTGIGPSAFYECSKLTSVTIPASVTSIGSCAFECCSNLTSITIPASVTSIGGSAFRGCSNLTAVYTSDLAAWCNITFGHSGANPLGNAKNLYLNGQLVTALEIPSGVTAIKDYAFYNCTKLTSVTIPASVTSIGERAFYYCTKLTSVTISEGVTSIGDDAFYGCSQLTSVTFTNPNGWWRANSSTATSGTDIPAADLSAPETAATYLKSTYYDYYWKRT